MLKAKFRLNTSAEIEHARQEINELIANSALTAETADFLYQQIITSFDQFERQLQADRNHTFNADRTFEGDGYKIVVNVSSKRPSFLSKFFR